MNKLGKLEKKVKSNYVMHTGGTSFVQVVLSVMLSLTLVLGFP